MARFHNPPLDRCVGEELVFRGFLVAEPEASRVDVILLGAGFRYTPAFWQHAGALARSEGGCGWRVDVGTPEIRAEVLARLVREWLSAGAPAGWAGAEATAALESLVAHGPCTSLGIEDSGAGEGARVG
jgi:hypothetical protein